MTILHLISSEGYYGAEAMLVTLARVQTAASHHVLIATFLDSRHPHDELAVAAKKVGLPVIPVPCSGRWDTSAWKEIQRILALHHVELLHTHGYKADLYGVSVARRGGVALVATCHNWPSRQLRMRVYEAIDKLVLRAFDRVAAVSESVAEKLCAAGFPAPRLRCISNGVEVGVFESAAPAVRAEHQWQNRPVIGFVGRMVSAKGGEVLLHAARRVLLHSPNAVFVFAGEGPAQAQWQSLAAELGVAGAVLFLGACKDMPPLYASFDVMVLPSFEEAMPMSVLEAMAAGKPVVASRVGGLPRLIDSGRNGILTEPGDADALADALLALLAAPDQAAALGRAAHDYVVRFHSAEAMEARYAELYRDALGERLRVGRSSGCLGCTR